MFALSRVRSLLGRLGIPGFGELPYGFSEREYLLANPDVARAVETGAFRSGAQHWLTAGRHEDRRLTLSPPLPGEFDPKAYLEMNPDVAEAIAQGQFPSALDHFAFYGRGEGRVWRRAGSEAHGKGHSDLSASSRGRATSESGELDVASYLAMYPDIRDHFGDDAPAILAHWYSRGFAEGRIPFGLRPFASRKTGEEFFSKAGAINLYGHFDAFSGLGSSVRAYRSALQAAGFEANPINIRFEAGRFETDPDVREGAAANTALCRNKLNIFHLNADMVQLFFQDGRRHLLDDSFNIGIWYWELAHFRPDWSNVFGAFDEIWVASEFCREAIGCVSPVPVVKMPLAIGRPSGEQMLPRGHFGIDDDAFVFGCIFDVGSGLARKNPQAAIEAFIREFGERSDVVLLLKYHSSRHDREGLRALHGLAAGRNNIRFFGHDFSEQENVSFKHHLNCLVSPHRSEGFGLNLAEAMVLGIPVIATGYSGNMDFMDGTNSYLLDYRLTEVREQFGPYLPGSLWAEPSADDLAAKMREVFEDRAGAARRAARGRERILQNYSPEGFSKALAARIGALEVFRPGGDAFRQSWGAGMESASIFHGREGPKFSIAVPVYNVEAELIRRCVASVVAQTHPNWELILYDDGSTNAATLAVLDSLRGSDSRIKVWFSTGNRGIAAATNAAIALSSGSFVGFLDNDDELTPDALAATAQAIRANPNADLLYSDEDKIDEAGNYCDHYFKPDWSPEHLESVMYLLHLMVIRRSLLLELGGLRDRFSGAQDYDLALRASRTARRIVHIPKILYHWRKIPGSAAAEVDAKPVALERAKEALQDHLDASGRNAIAVPGLALGLFRVKDAIAAKVPVTLAIFTDNRRAVLPGRGDINLFDNFLESILSRTATTCDMHVLAVDNGNLSREQREKVENHNGEVASYRGPAEAFNFSKKANFAFQHVRTELVVLLNDDMEIIEPGWLDALVELASRPTTGVVGGKLLSHKNTIQHCGVVLGINNNVAHVYHQWPADQIGYNGYTDLIRNYLAVTGACLATRMSIVSEIGGFDEELAIDYNDIDFCLKVFSAGYRNIYTPFAKLYHFEGLTAQRSTQNPKERKIFLERWHNYMSCDPYYNPNLSRQRLDFAAREPAQ